MDLRRLTAGSAGVALALVVLLPGVASAAEAPFPTPDTTTGGCALNGAKIAEAASAPGSFGAGTVSKNTPIAPLNAFFFSTFCPK